MPSVVVRPVRPTDRAFLVSLAPRFVEFGVPAWLDTRETLRALEAQFEQLARAVPEGHRVLVAESAEGEPLGFIYLQVQREFFTGRPHAHVSDLAVAEGADGKGVGRALVSAGEAWARAQGYDRLTLNVFATNTRARAFYAHLGFGEETLKLVKAL